MNTDAENEKTGKREDEPKSELPQVALSIRQPWAWLILHAGKDIENRNWPTKVHGRILIHAGKGMTQEEYEDAVGFAEMIEYGRGESSIVYPRYEDMQRGGIVGEVEIVDCLSRSRSPWFVGEFGFLLRNPKILPFQPCKGMLGFFKPSLA